MYIQIVAGRRGYIPVWQLQRSILADAGGQGVYSDSCRGYILAVAEDYILAVAGGQSVYSDRCRGYILPVAEDYILAVGGGQSV